MEVENMTREAWNAFKKRREAQRYRDEQIKEFVRDLIGAAEIIALMALAWFMLAVLYA